MNKEFLQFIILLVWFLWWFATGYIIRCIYCKWKQKHKTQKRCFFWNCKEWHNCPLNYKENDCLKYYLIIDKKRDLVIDITCSKFLFYGLMSLYKLFIGKKNIDYFVVNSDKLFIILNNIARFPNIPIKDIYDFYERRNLIDL